MSLALWLRAGRAQKGLSLEAVAKITKIQPRILERLEAGKLDGLPAEVFVRGFIRSVAKCVGLDESEALVRYSAAQGAPTTIPTATPSAVAFVESMSDLAPSTSSLLAPVVLVSNPAWPAASHEAMPALADELDDVEIDVGEPVVEPAIVTAPVEAPAKSEVVEPAKSEAIEATPVEATPVEATPVEVTPVEAAPVVDAPVPDAPAVEAAPIAPATTGKKKRSRKPRGTSAGKGKRKAMATGTPSSAMPVVAASVETVVESAPTTETKTNETKTNETKTNETKTVETSPVENAPSIENASVESAAVETASASTETTAADELFGASAAIDASELVDATSSSVSASTDDVTSSGTEDTSSQASITDDSASPSTDDPVATSGTWKPSMPVVTASSVPWRRPSLGIYATSTAPVVPTLVIDDADPETAASQQEDRANVPRRSFLPPILAERAKHGASGQGTLTLAVIILLIAATLTLSYLMRRPSSSGDGVTRADGTVELIG